MTTRTRFTQLGFLILFFGLIGCASNKALSFKANGYPCIIKSEFQLGGIIYSSDSSKVKEILGEPVGRYKYDEPPSEDWAYPSMLISITNDHVYNISTGNSEVSTPSGIRVGQSKSKVFKELGIKVEKVFNGVIFANNEYQFVNCETELYLVLNFNENNILIQIEMGIDLP